MTKSLAAAIAMLSIASATANAACRTLVTCVPDSTFVCRNGQVDIRVYASRKLGKIFVRANRVFDLKSKEDVAINDRRLTQGGSWANGGIASEISFPASPARRKQFLQVTLITLGDGQLRLDAGTWGPIKVQCERLSGRHLD